MPLTGKVGDRRGRSDAQQDKGSGNLCRLLHFQRNRSGGPAGVGYSLAVVAFPLETGGMVPAYRAVNRNGRFNRQMELESEYPDCARVASVRGAVWQHLVGNHRIGSCGGDGKPAIAAFLHHRKNRANRVQGTAEYRVIPDSCPGYS